MEEVAPTQTVDQSNLIPLDLFEQVIIPTDLAINSADLISIAIREADIPLRADDPPTPQNGLKCKHCSFTTSYKEYLTRHMRSHNAKQFSCKLCDYKTNSESGFRNHRTSHETKVVKACRHKYCQDICKVEANRKKFESVIKRLFNCEACDFVTEKRQLFLEHTKQHCYDLQFNNESEHCSVCQMHIVKNLMDEHMKMHSEDVDDDD